MIPLAFVQTLLAAIEQIFRFLCTEQGQAVVAQSLKDQQAAKQWVNDVWGSLPKVKWPDLDGKKD